MQEAEQPTPAAKTSIGPKTGDTNSGWQKASRDSMNQVRAEFDDLVNDVRTIFTRDLASATTLAFDGIGETPKGGFTKMRTHFDILVGDVTAVFKKDLVGSNEDFI